MRTLKFGVLILLLAVLFTACDKSNRDKLEINALSYALVDPNPVLFGESDCGELYETKLIAGQHIEAGSLSVWVQDGTLMVKYIANPGVLIAETHLAVEQSADAIPHNKTGNPKIGNFEYNGEHNPPLAEVIYEIDLDKNNLEGIVSIAAHAVVMLKTGERCLSYTEIEAMLPDNPVGLEFAIDKIDNYYDLTLSDAGEFTGTHPAWCADNNDKPVDYNPGTLVSSYNTDLNLLQSIVPHPENLDLLNFMMNNYYPETSYYVLQLAIWTLMNGTIPDKDGADPKNIWIGGLLTTPAQRIAATALVNEVKNAEGSEGFIPGPGDFMVILVKSEDRTKYQNVFFLYKKCVPIYKDETAWGQGYPLTTKDNHFTPDGGSWATYFGYCTGR